MVVAVVWAGVVVVVGAARAGVVVVGAARAMVFMSEAVSFELCRKDYMKKARKKNKKISENML